MRYLPIFLIALFSISFLACVNDKSETSSPKDAPTELPMVEIIRGVPIGFQDFRIIGELEKLQGTEADEMVKAECEKWTVDLGSLENILPKMEEVSGTEAYGLCYQYPCQYNGLLSDGTQEYKIIVHSGGHIVIKTDTEGEELNFILKEAYEGHPFFDICDCCE